MQKYEEQQAVPARFRAGARVGVQPRPNEPQLEESAFEPKTSLLLSR